MEGIAAFYLAEKLTDFNAIHPDIVVKLVTERHLINLAKREADVSINFVPPVGSRLNERKAGTFKLGLFGSAAHPEHRGIPQTVENPPSHDFVDYIVDLVAIPKVRWLLDVLELEHVVIRSSSVDAQQNAHCGRTRAWAAAILLSQEGAETRAGFSCSPSLSVTRFISTGFEPG